MVDGSNLATEGRTSPSLKQLDEAVRAYAAEDPGSSIIVVVDATFEHRVSEAEREEVREAMLNGEIISPPAGAIGRGDAFVLRIAERTGAIVLSNDSFQEFHGEHPWLFDEGRLIGGKPVPGVGWIFTPRLPIRGPKSRAATAEAKSQERPRVRPGQGRGAGPGGQEGGEEGDQGQEGGEGHDAPRRHVLADHARHATPGSGQGRPRVLQRHRRGRRGGAAPAQAPEVEGLGQEAGGEEGGTAEERQGKEGPGGDAGGGQRPTPRPSNRASNRCGGATKKGPTPPPAVNEPLAFINFVAAFPVGSTVEGEVVSFTSHGAMVDVSMPGGGVLHCYIPLTAMGTPPPTKARQVLKKGEGRPFVLAGLDPPRRVAELARPGAPGACEASVAQPAPDAGRVGGDDQEERAAGEEGRGEEAHGEEGGGEEDRDEEGRVGQEGDQEDDRTGQEGRSHEGDKGEEGARPRRVPKARAR